MPVRNGRGAGSRHLEEAHVYQVYNQIAPKFNCLSQKAWPNVRRFLKDIAPGSLVADIGCGSGRYLPINKHLTKIGIDICCPLVESARNKGHEVLVADNLHIPFRDNSFDAVISIGVIHHFSSRSRRLEAIKELSRVLCVGGKLMIYVWAFEQKKRRFESQDVLIPWNDGVKETVKSGLSSQSSCSDKDISSSTSVVSEELSSLGSQNDLRPHLHHAISDPSSSGYTTKSRNEIDSYIQSLPEDSNKISLRHRCNTLPSSLEGILSDEEHEENHSNLLAKECRKLEATLRAMSSSEYHLPDGEENALEEICGNGFHGNEEVFDRKEDMFKNQGDVYRRYSSTRTRLNGMKNGESGKDKNLNCSTKEVEVSSSHNRNGKCSNIDSKEVFPSCGKSHTSQECISPRQALTKVDQNFTKVVVEDKNIPSNIKEEKVSSTKEKTKTSFFQNLKESFLKLIEGKPAKKERKLSKGSVLLNSEGDNLIPVDFAVREFPQSSCPTYRLERLNSQKGSKQDADQLGKNETKLQLMHSNSREKNETFDGIHDVDEIDRNLAEEVSNYSVKHHSDKKETISKAASSGCLNSSQFGEKRNLSQSEIQNPYSQSHKNGTNKKHLLKKSISTSLKHISGTNGHETSSTSYHSFVDDISNLQSYRQNKNSAMEKSEDPLHSGLSVTTFHSEEMLTYDSLPYDSIQCDGKSLLSSISSSPKLVPLEKSTSHKNDIKNQNRVPSSFKGGESGSKNAVKELSRYYHVFKDGELSKLISNHIESLHIVSCTYDHGNWCIVAQKVKPVDK